MRFVEILANFNYTLNLKSEFPSVNWFVCHLTFFIWTLQKLDVGWALFIVRFHIGKKNLCKSTFLCDNNVYTLTKPNGRRGLTLFDCWFFFSFVAFPLSGLVYKTAAAPHLHILTVIIFNDDDFATFYPAKMQIFYQIRPNNFLSLFLQFKHTRLKKNKIMNALSQYYKCAAWWARSRIFTLTLYVHLITVLDCEWFFRAHAKYT